VSIYRPEQVGQALSDWLAPQICAQQISALRRLRSTTKPNALGAAMGYTTFVEQRQGPLLRFAMVLCGDSALAEDLVQEALARCYAQWERLSAVDNLNGYVRRMIVNDFITWRRRFGRLHLVESLVEPAVADTSDAYADRDALVAELAKLPPKQRAVLVLRYYEGLTDAEIAEALGCRGGTVRAYATRALAALRIELNLSTEAVR
jgi:RNA polymerase sigma-70 factor (sigma-E family)